ncbi:MAG TPA: lysophospholipase [Chthoniobacterales bacterium]|nr:lysophospholipase [Chthoniobacterales bacterium]
MESFTLPDHSSWRDLRSTDGTKLFCREWQTQTSAKGTVVMVPGLGEHTGRYVHVGDFFQRAGFNVLGIDVRGQGRSGGTPGYVESYDQFLEDVRAGIRAANVFPLFVLGHSFGGQLALALARRNEPNIAGYLVSGPWLALTKPPAAWLVGLGSLMNRVYPKCHFPTGIERSQNSSDEAHLDSLVDLDFNHGFIAARTFFEIIAEARRLLANPRANGPVLIAQGRPDAVTSVEASIQFYQRLEAPAKELKIYDGFRHELHNERGRAGVLEDYLAWIEKTIPLANPSAAM